MRMQQIREQEQAEAGTRSSSSILPSTTLQNPATTTASNVERTHPSNMPNSESDTRTPPKPTVEDTKTTKLATKIPFSEPMQTNTTILTNPCALCMNEEKRIACIPCGHFATCVSCGHSLRSCPICRREIEAFVRIYI
ncbi:unnamed protein product [Rotaria sordida]|uniref:RING-type domain-containing protein n=1 Tax=Rotaria sordida TaxID=392033 RepID=A0A815UEZ3_9BILA|nr:unnamed protein product [Rotaria sordida]CAF1294731.1 unnamed protein product [Rotaria sordida]CAF1515283.1 unnamed protein product [Rotaria sordida]